MNRRNRNGFRKCSCCKNEKELTEGNFCKDKNRPFGFSYRCKKCDSLKTDLRKHRYKKLTEAEKEKYKAKNREYTSYGVGRAISMICAYRKVDRKKGHICDLDKKFMIDEIFNKPCFYCGETDKLGCDRINNDFGHTKNNVVPCCRSCNTTRMHNYTHQEMIILGRTIRYIKQLRKDGMHFQLSKLP